MVNDDYQQTYPLSPSTSPAPLSLFTTTHSSMWPREDEMGLALFRPIKVLTCFGGVGAGAVRGAETQQHRGMTHGVTSCRATRICVQRTPVGAVHEKHPVTSADKEPWASKTHKFVQFIMPVSYRSWILKICSILFFSNLLGYYNYHCFL